MDIPKNITLPKNINEIIDTGLTTTEIKEYFSTNGTIVMQSELAHMNSLEEVFQGKQWVVLFTSTQNPDLGHYQLLFKNSQGLFFFDSYGMKPETLILRVQKDLKGNTWGQNAYALTKLIAGSPYRNHFFINKYKYQSDNIKVETCGRYCLVVALLNYLYTNANKPFNFQTFQYLMNLWKKRFKVSYDEIVSYFITSTD